jgi:hypothetical protein
MPPVRVFVLGATGQVGRSVAGRIKALPRVSSVVVAGRDLDRAQLVADELGATAAAVAAEDEDRLAALLGDCDAIVNVGGPDASVLMPALRSAIRSGTPYCDISADGATIEGALDLHESALAAGVTALVGIGSAPGLTNLLCRHAAAQFDEIEEIRFGYVWECPRPEEARRLAAEMSESRRIDASWETLFRYVAGPVRIVIDGSLRSVDAWGEPERIDLPESGAFSGYAVGSAEPVTLARNLPGVRRLVSLVGMFPPSANDLWKQIAQRIASGATTSADAVIEMHHALAEEPDSDRAALVMPPYPIGVNAVGRRDGESIGYRAQPSDMWMTTGIMATAACDWLLEERRQAGVFAPEAVLDPLPFFASAAGIWGGELPAGRLLIESFAPKQTRTEPHPDADGDRTKLMFGTTAGLPHSPAELPQDRREQTSTARLPIQSRTAVRPLL